MVEIERRNS